MLSLEIPVVTVHGEASRVLVRVAESKAVEFWYAEIRHGVIPLRWLHAWVDQLTARAPGRFGGVVLTTGPAGGVLLSIAPEIIDLPLAAADLDALLGR
ncbi:hypothetical protein [Kineosporia babensis]|uniref:Uncharacterized protein n=1 Tax=Kineosporia babensis TaxID=499548 RepID=A0A9X1NH73_9ACTN|nr:hypothetical protein [Kineosporia babensis]MCD5314992.1 hypothetical protein [Kineosporia babensis]